MGEILWLGAAAGVGTALVWSVSCTVHAAVSCLVGVHALLILRQPLALIVLGVLCLMGGQFAVYSSYALGMALLSGVFGIMLCDWCLYEAASRIGLRSALVCSSSNVCITALLGVIFLDESLGMQGMAGILAATAGIILVILSEHNSTATVPVSRRQWIGGVVLGFVSAVATAVSMILSKESMNDGVPPLMVGFLRNISATLIFWSAGYCLHRIRSSFTAARTHPMAIKLLLIGCVFGTAFGTWLYMTALANAPVAVATTLIGLQPVALLVVTGLWERRCPALGSILGSVIACSGAAILVLR